MNQWPYGSGASNHRGKKGEEISNVRCNKQKIWTKSNIITDLEGINQLMDGKVICPQYRRKEVRVDLKKQVGVVYELELE